MFFVTIVSGKFSKSIDDNFHSDTILQLKQSINKHHGIPINLIKLSYNGIQLNDNKKISDYFIQSYDKIDLDLKLLEINFSKTGMYQMKWYVEEGTNLVQLQNRIIGKIFGIIIGINENHILNDGETIFLG
jgi:hypothetical protein